MAKIYYAHHLWKYNTKIEEYELDLIRKYFSNHDIINPNGAVNADQEELDIMRDCLKLVRDSDIVVFSSLSGTIGKGVYMEVGLGMVLNKDVYYIFNNKINPVDEDVIGLKIIEDSNTDRLYANVAFYY